MIDNALPIPANGGITLTLTDLVTVDATLKVEINSNLCTITKQSNGSLDL